MTGFDIAPVDRNVSAHRQKPDGRTVKETNPSFTHEERE